MRTADFHQALQAAVKTGLQVRVVFGDPALQQYIILLGPNGWTLGHNLPPPLLQSMDKVYEAESTIARIRGLNGQGRFLLEETIVEEEADDDGNDDDGADSEEDGGIVRTCYHSNGLSPHLTEALKKSLESESESDLHEIAMGSDKSWLIIRDDSHESSVGVSDELIQLLDAFYQRHKERQESREREIARSQQGSRSDEKKEDLATVEERQRVQKEQAAAAEARRQARREWVEKTWTIGKKRRSKEDRIAEIEWKKLREGDFVTVLGLSSAPGDAMIKQIQRQGEVAIVVVRESETEEGTLTETTIHDPSRITKHNRNESGFDERSELFQLAVAEDKFVAAILQYHSHVPSNSCPCKKDFIGYSQRFLWPNPWQPGDEVHVIGYADGKVIEPEPRYASNPYLVHVQYEDGSSYHVAADQVRPVHLCVSAEQCCAFQPIHQAEEAALRIRPLFEDRSSTTPLLFDEYQCAEKIDMRRLQSLADNFRLDCAERRHCMNDIVEKLDQAADR